MRAPVRRLAAIDRRAAEVTSWQADATPRIALAKMASASDIDPKMVA